MNKRQYKKKKLKFWALAGEPYVTRWEKGIPYFESDSQCPFCGYEAADGYDDPEKIKELENLGGYSHIVDLRHYFDGNYSGKEWTVEFKCPICKTIFEFDDSDV